MPGNDPPSLTPLYRAFRVSPGGRISSVPVILDAADDDKAIAQARHLVDGAGIEVWDRTRRVVVLSSMDKSRDGSAS